ncbi:MAG TPA: hypothetical protein PLM37_11575 [Elusimicrobiota bacterium]|nr:hypothetical protein [Elusimicrobiota bacterium]
MSHHEAIAAAKAAINGLVRSAAASCSKKGTGCPAHRRSGKRGWDWYAPQGRCPSLKSAHSRTAAIVSRARAR